MRVFPLFVAVAVLPLLSFAAEPVVDYASQVALVKERASPVGTMKNEPIYVVTSLAAEETRFSGGKSETVKVPLCLIVPYQEGIRIGDILGKITNAISTQPSHSIARIYRSKEGLVAELKAELLRLSQYPLKSGDLIVFSIPKK